jgi:hypothetical protein
MRGIAMIDPALIPAHVWPRRRIDQLNALLARLEARKVDRIIVPEPESDFRASNIIRVYCQAHLRRCLVLFESAYGLFFTENGLVSLICVRAIYETVANFLHFEKQLQDKLAEGDLQAIFEYAKTKTHATRVEPLIEEHGEHLKAISILTQIDKMVALRATIREEYDFLSDHTHPNSFGSVLFFAELPRDKDIATFRDGGPDPGADLQWILVGCDLLQHFEHALDRIEAALPALSQKGREQSPVLAKKRAEGLEPEQK